ncbi:MAG: hypothetical protein GTO14_10745, partial [Anaerolineales bacterium]|nr:hypothetical protein [Anaerolineales bacterium]
QVAVFQAPRNGVFYRAKHVLPRRAKGLGHVFPTETLGPARQEPAIGRRQLMLAVTPGDLFHLHPTPRAVHTPHRVHEENRNLPQRYKLEPPRWLTVVAGRRLVAVRANRTTVGT